MSRRVTRLCQRGFTLVEILVAMLVMAVLSVLAYQAFDGILAMEARSKEQFLEENRRSLATSIILNDFLHMRARPVRDQLGGIKPAFMAPSGEHQVEFTRGGLPDFATMAGGIQRLAYRVEGDRLIRTSWEVADEGPQTRQLDQVLAAGVTGLTAEMLDPQGLFVPQWPPLNVGAGAGSLPAMVRITLHLAGGDELVVMAPGVDGDWLAGLPEGADE